MWKLREVVEIESDDGGQKSDAEKEMDPEDD